MVIFMPIEIFFLKKFGVKKLDNYIVGRAIAILIHQLIITIPFYLYRWIFGVEYLIVDIILYGIGSFVAAWVTYKWLFNDEVTKLWVKIGVISLIVQMLLLWVFTFYTPKLPLFMEDHSGRYGTEWEYHPEEDDGHDH